MSLGVGLAIGLVLTLTLGLARVLAQVLFEVQPRDPAVFLGVAALLVAAGTLACLIPARRATRVDPMEALRYE